MSKLKNPRAKKAASLKRDHRSAGGHRGKASRKTVPRTKVRTHRELRRAVHQAIDVGELSSETGLERAENAAVNAARDAKTQGRKEPDVPLGKYLERKQRRRPR